MLAETSLSPADLMNTLLQDGTDQRGLLQEVRWAQVSISVLMRWKNLAVMRTRAGGSQHMIQTRQLITLPDGQIRSVYNITRALINLSFFPILHIQLLQ